MEQAAETGLTPQPTTHVCFSPPKPQQPAKGCRDPRGMVCGALNQAEPNPVTPCTPLNQAGEKSGCHLPPCTPTQHFCSPRAWTDSPGWQKRTARATAGPESAWQVHLTLSSGCDPLPGWLWSRQLESHTFAGHNAAGPQATVGKGWGWGHPTVPHSLCPLTGCCAHEWSGCSSLSSISCPVHSGAWK